MLKFAIICAVLTVNDVLSIYSANDGIKTNSYRGHSPSNYRDYQQRNYNTPTPAPSQYRDDGRNRRVNDNYEEESNFVETQQPRTECPPGATGQFPYMHDCKRFLNCWKGRGFVQACAPGTAFNPETLECDNPTKVNCLGSGGGVMSSRYEDFSQSQPPRSNLNAEQLEVTCGPGVSGIRPHPFHCNQFLNCDHGRTHIQDCGPGTLFNPLYSVCDHPHNVDCEGRQIFTQNNNDNVPSASQFNHNISPNRNENLNRNPKHYEGNQHNYHMGMPQPHSHSNPYQQEHRTYQPEPQQHSYQHRIPNQPIPESYPVTRKGYPHPHQHYPNRNTQQYNPSQSNFPDQNPQQTNTNFIYQQVPRQPLPTSSTNLPSYSRRTTTRFPQTTHRPTNSVYSKNPYDISQVTVHEIPTNTNTTTRIYFAEPVEYDSNENDDDTQRTLQPRNNDEQQQILPNNYDRTTTQRTTTQYTTYKPNFRPIRTSTTYRPPSTTPRRYNVPNTPSSTLEPNIVFAEPVHSDETFTNIAGGDIPIYNGDTYKPSSPMQPPANHLLPPFPRPNVTTPLPPPSNTFAPNRFHTLPEDKRNSTSNVRTFPIYRTTIRPTTTRSNIQPLYSAPYSGVLNMKNHPSSSSANNYNPDDMQQRQEPIIFNRNDDLDVEESAIKPIYVRPPTTQTPPPTQTTILHKQSAPPPVYNQRPIPTTTQMPEQNFETENLPLSDALKILLRPYASKNDSNNMLKKIESRIMNIENNQEIEKLKKQVEIIVTGEQENMNRSYYETTTIKPTPHHVQHFHPTHNKHLQHHHHHSREFHQRHPNLPNPFEDDDDEKQNKNSKKESTTYKPTIQHSPDVELVNRNFINVQKQRPLDEIDNEPEIISTTNTKQGAVTTTTEPEYCQFDCGNGKCIKHFEVCDGVNNCGNRKDEQKCDKLGYEVRLVNDNGDKHAGRVEVKVNGNWGYVCDDKFDMNDANVVCRELGFEMGASEIRGNSYYLPSVNRMSSYTNVSFVMDELDCRGNESSLRECDFKGWGVHDCNADEVVGVVCKIPVIKCPHDYWLCKTSLECIPPNFVCDNIADCSDKSDESNEVCKSKIEYRLVNGKTRLEGRVEVKYRNEWGTICDDDFGPLEALVVCKTLGYHGQAEVVKDTFGAGYGPIWLDQVSCFGNETCLNNCTHWKWGENNCNHNEDVGIRCSVGNFKPEIVQIKGKQQTQRNTEFEEDEDDDLDYLLYNTRSSKLLDLSKPKCGHYNPDILDQEFEERQLQRIRHGNIARLGRHPWQATIRVKGVDGASSHLCGAVLIARRFLLTAAHCISDYEKGAFFIRLGDHHTDRKEDGERDIFIHDWYIHENYRKVNHMNNDIALIVIKEPVQYSDYIQPICLPEENSVYQPQKMCTISGWGSEKTGQSAPSKILRGAEIPILSDEVCKKPDVYGRHITEGMFCAGFLDGQFDACDGDSGGPMACTDGRSQVLYGITSWGLRCGLENKPGVYVKVAKYVEWIKRKINHVIQSRNK